MAEVLFKVRYTLGRRERLLPHLVLWGSGTVTIPLGLAILLALMTVTWWAAALALLWAWFFQNFFRGIINVATRAKMKIALRVELDGLTWACRGTRGRLPWTGFHPPLDLVQGVWTLLNESGAVINIPCEAITPEQLAYLRTAVGKRAGQGLAARGVPPMTPQDRDSGGSPGMTDA